MPRHIHLHVLSSFLWAIPDDFVASAHVRRSYDMCLRFELSMWEHHSGPCTPAERCELMWQMWHDGRSPGGS